jgi:hypothetical protein
VIDPIREELLKGGQGRDADDCNGAASVLVWMFAMAVAWAIFAFLIWR